MKARKSLFIIVIVVLLSLVAILPSFVFAEDGSSNVFSEEEYLKYKAEEHGGTVYDIVNEKKGARTFSLPVPKVYDKSTKFVVSETRPLKLFVNAGHGGSNTTPGKRTPAPETQEWYFNNAVATAFSNYILSEYKNVEINRIDRENKDVPLTERTNTANNWGADAYLSFHHNAFQGVWGNHGGTETWRYPTTTNQETIDLANTVQRAMVRANGLRDRGVKESTGFHELKATRMPAVIMEGAFMDSLIDIQKMRVNPGESNTALNTPALSNVGREVADAIANLYGLEKKDSVPPIPEPVLYELSFDLNGGSGTAPSNMIANAEGVITDNLPTVGRDGYEFVGWTKVRDAEETVSVPLTITSNTTLYAKWKEIVIPKHTVSFDLNGAPGKVPAVVEADENGKVINLPTLEWDGYKFLGWMKTKNAAKVVALPLTITGDITLYAKWEEIETPEGAYSVSFNLNGGDGEVPAAKISDGNGRIKSLPIVSRVGYDFIGWTEVKDSDQLVIAPLTLTSNIVLYAKWEKIKALEVTLDLNGAPGEVPAPVEADANGKVISLPTLNRKGYNFLGWTKTKNAAEVVTLPLTITSNITLYAKWEKIETPEVKYGVLLDLNGVSAEKVGEVVTDANGQVISLPTLIRSGYKFLGWTKDVTSNKLVQLPLTLVADVTLYPVWEEDKAEETVTSHKVSFDLRGGKGNFDSITVADNALYKLPDNKPTKEGYLFTGWFTEATGGIKVPTEFNVTKDITLYAHWSKIVDNDVKGEGTNNEGSSTNGNPTPKTGDQSISMQSIVALISLSAISLFVITSRKHLFNKNN